jgi:hypothetical protein
MMTDYEKARVKEMRDILLDSAIQMYGIDINEELKAEFVGANMATIDGLFAIRDGQPWRGLTDPKEIARAVLRQGKIGE